MCIFKSTETQQFFFSSPGFLPKLSCKQEFPHIKHIWSTLSAHSSPLPQCWFRFIHRRLPSVQLLAGLPDGSPEKFHNSSCVPHCLQGKVQMQNPTPSAPNCWVWFPSSLRSPMNSQWSLTQGAFFCPWAFESGVSLHEASLSTLLTQTLPAVGNISYYPTAIISLSGWLRCPSVPSPLQHYNYAFSSLTLLLSQEVFEEGITLSSSQIPSTQHRPGTIEEAFLKCLLNQWCLSMVTLETKDNLKASSLVWSSGLL